MYCRDIKPRFDSMSEECGVFGIYSQENKNLAYSVYYGLYALQHRGQEAGGIAVTANNKIEYYKDLGLIPEIFANGKLEIFPEGDIAIGHVRYASSGQNLPVNAQPLVFTGKSGKMALALNGNIINAYDVKKGLIDDGVLFQSTTDAEVISALINKHTKEDIVEGVIQACKELKGAFAFVLMTKDKLIAVRDSFGICPLALGKVDDDYVVSSETCGLDAINANYIKDITPGEVIVIDAGGIKEYTIGTQKQTASCIFEYVYFARPDSIIDGCSVYESRKEAGRILAKNYPIDADIVAGVPDSAIVSARGYSEQSGIPYTEVLNKNRYIGRTFIQPLQGMRENSVRIKMNAIRSNIQGKRIILLDDSIVRGTTSKKIVKLLKDAGAKEVHLRICSPMVKHPCYFGIDMQTYSQLIGANKSEEEICEYIGADSLKFLTIEELKQTACDSATQNCLGCFNGEYPYEINKKEINKKNEL